MGFVRGGQYAVCLALIVDGHVQLGVMGCPNLQNPDGGRGNLFVTVKNQGAFQVFVILILAAKPTLPELSIMFRLLFLSASFYPLKKQQSM